MLNNYLFLSEELCEDIQILNATVTKAPKEVPSRGTKRNAFPRHQKKCLPEVPKEMPSRGTERNAFPMHRKKRLPDAPKEMPSRGTKRNAFTRHQKNCLPEAQKEMPFQKIRTSGNCLKRVCNLPTPLVLHNFFRHLLWKKMEKKKERKTIYFLNRWTE